MQRFCGLLKAEDGSPTTPDSTQPGEKLEEPQEGTAGAEDPKTSTPTEGTANAAKVGEMSLLLHGQQPVSFWG